jgi:hypothetical protein
MHPNVYATAALVAVPAIVLFIITCIVIVIKKRWHLPLLIATAICAVFPVVFPVSHYLREKNKMKELAGTYKAIRFNALDNLCPSDADSSLYIVLSGNGTWSFDHKPCFADRQSGIWKWTDDLVGTFANFDARIEGSAYLKFDKNDVLHLVDSGNDLITFSKVNDYHGSCSSIITSVEQQSISTDSCISCNKDMLVPF